MKKIRCIVATLFFVLLLVPGHLLAQDAVFGTFPIPLMVIDNENGVFVELTKEISKRAGLSIDILVNPPIRTIKDFEKGKVDVIFPALDVSFPVGAKYKKSDSIYLKQDYIFTKKGTPTLKTIAELEGNKIGITRGYPYVRELIENSSINFDIANSDEINAKKLVGGRIDAFVVEERTGIQAFENIRKIASVQYDKTAPMSKQEVYFACPDTEKGKMLAGKISKAMKTMKEDGTFGKIMAKASQ